MLNCVRKTFLILGLSAALGGCASLPLPAVWDGTEMGEYVGANGEFVVAYPHDKFGIKELTRENFNAVDFIGVKLLKPQYVYSVEWTTLPQAKAQTDEEFFAYWQDFLPTYLSGNFGDGHYDKIQWERIDTFQGRPAFRFVGSGKHNGGSPGVIYGTAIGFGHRMAVAYALGPAIKDPKAAVDTLPGYPVYWKFASSLRCKVGCE